MLAVRVQAVGHDGFGATDNGSTLLEFQKRRARSRFGKVVPNFTFTFPIRRHNLCL